MSETMRGDELVTVSQSRAGEATKDGLGPLGRGNDADFLRCIADTLEGLDDPRMMFYGPLSPERVRYSVRRLRELAAASPSPAGAETAEQVALRNIAINQARMCAAREAYLTFRVDPCESVESKLHRILTAADAAAADVLSARAATPQSGENPTP